jgi:impB/mucB/samB family protein
VTAGSEERSAAKGAIFFVRTQDFQHMSLEAALSRPTNLAHQLLGVLKPRFGRIFRPSTLYRAAGVVLLKLEAETTRQLDLFGETLRAERVRQLYHTVDAINRKDGKHTVFLGSSFPAVRQGSQRFRSWGSQ